MRKFFRKLFDIREGETLRALLMFFYIFLLIASLMIVKPIRNSLFLVEFGVKKLPYVFILVAFFSALVASLYSRYSKKTRLNYLVLNTIFISIACLLVFWLVLHFGYQRGWILYAFYIWVAIFAVITSTQFWLLANYIFNAREAKRLFGFIGAGAISGGIFGGYLTNLLAPRLKTENLIFFCIGFLIICLFLLWLIWQKSAPYIPYRRVYRQRQINQFESSDNPIKLILNSRHLVYLAGIIGVSVVVANLVDYQFSDVASRVITDTDRLTAFFGFWMSTLSIASLLIQLFFTNRTMKYLGVAASLFFLPVALFVGAVAVLVNPTLWTAILIKVNDGSLKHSINKAGTELLALPIVPEIKNKAKAFIDVFIKNFAKGLGGILLIAITLGLGFSVRYISLVIIGLIAVWIFLITRVKDEYVNSFRMAIEKRSIDIGEQSLNLQDASVFKSFLKVLDRKSERQMIYVLNLLEDVKNNELIPYLKKLIKYPSNEVKSLVLKMALQYEELDLNSEARSSIDSNNQTLRTEAIHYLCKRSDDKTSILKTYLDHADYRIRCAAIMCVSREWRESMDFRKDINIKELLDGMLKSLQQKKEDNAQKRFIKINTARAIGEAQNPELYSYLHKLLNDESVEVVQAAVTSVGQSQAKEFIPILISHLDTKHLHKYARESLAEYGEDIIDILAEHIESPNENKKIRLAIPRVLALIGSQKSVNLLTRNLAQSDLLLRYEIIKALNKLRVKFPLLKFDKQHIEARIMDETEQYYRILTLLHKQKNSLSNDKAVSSSKDGFNQKIKARRLLMVALEEKLDNNLERIFRLLGLKYPAKDMFNAYLAVKSNRSNLRATSVEFLDNILEVNLKRILIPIIESTKDETLLAKSQELFGFDIPKEIEWVNFILEGDDNWLKICTLYLIAELNYDKPMDTIAKLVDDPDPMVKETAKYYLKRIGISN
jgi:AAA family ATP:ADP antiporter